MEDIDSCEDDIKFGERLLKAKYRVNVKLEFRKGLGSLSQPNQKYK